MGAHLGVGGTIRFDTCIECPFHGWVFDGETGIGVLSGGDHKIIRTAEKYEYHDIDKCTPVPNDNENEQKTNTYLQKVAELDEVKIKKYVCREMNGSILVWYHSNDDLREKPLFEPFDLENELKSNKMEGKKKKNKVISFVVFEQNFLMI